jgi:anti-sigma regulatory factor (Ser/Thr protein kinase)
MIAMEEALDQMTLDSRLSELGQTWQWVENIADRRQLGAEARFAIHLCLEEALANIVIHGYGGEPGNPIFVCAAAKGKELLFVIEDRCPPFVPPLEPELELSGSPASLETIEPGGNGVRLMRQFAKAVVYEPLPFGNRLTLAFPDGRPSGD